MKKIAVFAFAVALFTTSCKKEEKNEEIVEPTLEVSGLKIITDSTKVNWTAFKTTEKIAVGGSFKSIELKDTKTGETPEEVLEGAAFSIPVSSLYTNNPDRDSKLLKFFFGTLVLRETNCTEFEYEYSHYLASRESPRSARSLQIFSKRYISGWV